MGPSCFPLPSCSCGLLFYHIARASATECGASLDELVDIAILAEPVATRLKGVLYQIIAMLIAMIRSLEQRPRQDMSR